MHTLMPGSRNRYGGSANMFIQGSPWMNTFATSSTATMVIDHRNLQVLHTLHMRVGYNLSLITLVMCKLPIQELQFNSNIGRAILN